MADKGLSLTELSKRVGITMANLSIIKTNKGRAVRFSTLEAICRELNCQPGDLLEFVTDDIQHKMPAMSSGQQQSSPNRSSDSGLPGDYY